MRKPNPETHQSCRSLLQKSVRRGNVFLTKEVANHLYEVGDKRWLKMRTAVIIFEECWPLGADLDLSKDFEDVRDLLIRVAQSVKMKDAAGLGTLAYALSEGDSSVLLDSSEDKHIKVVANAIDRPKDFWGWVTAECTQEHQRALVESAQQAYRRGGWPWDKAFMQAAAYLAVTNGLPDVRPAEQTSNEEFPFWVALDKHTPEGKVALREAAKQIGISFRQISWLSFYCESALTNDAADSFWWDKEVRWRLSQVGLDYNKAQSVWFSVKPVVLKILELKGEWLREHLGCPAQAQDNPVEIKMPPVEIQQEFSFMSSYRGYRTFAQGHDAVPNPYGPILLQIHPAAFREASDVAICLRSAGASDFDRENEALMSVQEVDRLFRYPVEAGFPRSAEIKFAEELQRHYPQASAPEISCTVASGKLPLQHIVVALVDPYVILERPLRVWVEQLNAPFPIRERSCISVRRMMFNELMSLLVNGIPSLQDLLRNPSVTQESRKWAQQVMARGLEYQFKRFANYLRDGTLLPLIGNQHT